MLLIKLNLWTRNIPLKAGKMSIVASISDSYLHFLCYIILLLYTIKNTPTLSDMKCR